MKILLLLPFLLAACVTYKSADFFIEEPIAAPKVIAIVGVRDPWVYEVEKRLRKRGFQIKRMASQYTAIEDVSANKTKIYDKAAARFMLTINGDIVSRCFAGGYLFRYLDVELIDVRKNETVLHYSSSGYSERCSPTSGTIFTDIENIINQAWEG